MRLAFLATTGLALGGCMSSPGDQLASIETLPPAHRTADTLQKSNRLTQQAAENERSAIANQALLDADDLNAQAVRNQATLNAQAAAIEAYAAKKRQQLTARDRTDSSLANSLVARRNIAAAQTSIYANADSTAGKNAVDPQRVTLDTTDNGIQPGETLNAAQNSIYSGQTADIARETTTVPLPDAHDVSKVQDLALAGKDVPSDMEIASADPAAADIAAATEDMQTDQVVSDQPMPSYDKALDQSRQEKPAVETKKKRLTLADFFRKKPVQTASFDGDRFGKRRDLKTRAIPNMQTASLGDRLPGVTTNAMMPMPNANDDEMGEDSDDDQPAGLMKLASLPGMMRVAPNGLWMQTDTVDVSCLRPQLVSMLKQVEKHYGRPVVVTSGYRNPGHNRRVGGVRHSLHTLCAAADIQIEGVSKWALADFLRSLPGRGGVGTYCHTESVHIDIGDERDWNWRCRRRRHS